MNINQKYLDEALEKRGYKPAKIVINNIEINFDSYDIGYYCVELNYQNTITAVIHLKDMDIFYN